MSYARFGEGDVYVYSTGQHWTCCACSLDQAKSSREFDTPEETLTHLDLHRNSGDRVPQRAIDRLCEEIIYEKRKNLARTSG